MSLSGFGLLGVQEFQDSCLVCKLGFQAVLCSQGNSCVWGKCSRDVMSKLTGVSDALTSSFKRNGLGYSSKGSTEASQEQLLSFTLPSSRGSCSRSD